MNGRGNRQVVEDKKLFAKEFADFTKRTIVPSDDVRTHEQFKELVDQFGSIIVKPRYGFNGNGIHKVYATDTDKSIKDEFEQDRGDQYVFEEILQQDGLLHDLNPQTLNTVRVNVLNDHGNIRVVNAILRSGQGDVVTDNICAGGVVSWVNIDTGEIESPFGGADVFLDITTELKFVHPVLNVFYRRGCHIGMVCRAKRSKRSAM